MAQWVNDDTASLDLIIDDVLNEWRQHQAAGNGTAGLEAFWNRYANAVEWAPSGSGHEYRSEFCSADEARPFDTDEYFHAVWAAHIGELRGSLSTSDIPAG